MKTTITVERSKEWVVAQRIKSGENVEDRIKVCVEVGDLPEDIREFLLAVTWDKSYSPTYDGFKFGSDYIFHFGSTYGHDHPRVDSDNPSIEDIANAIRAMRSRVDAERAEWLAKKAECERKDAEEKAAREAQQRKLTEARELLKQDIERVEDRLATAIQGLRLVSEFASYVSVDAQKEALAKMALERDHETIEELRTNIEDASPVALFNCEE